MTLQHLGALDIRQDNVEDGWKRLDEARAIWEAPDNPASPAHALRWLGRARNLDGKPNDALRLLARLREIFEDARDEEGAAYVAVETSLAALANDDLAGAKEHLRAALLAFTRLENTDGLVFAIGATADYAMRTDNSEVAATLWGAISEWRDESGAPAPKSDATLLARNQAIARARIGDAAFAAAWAVGRSRAFEDAVRDARGLVDSTTPRAVRAIPEPHPSATLDRTAWARAKGLTPREIDILPFLIGGRTDEQIGASLFISRRTVTTHVSSILSKLDVRSRTAVAAIAVRNGMESR
jgi:DNA-binding CsgD family transcriptional regulator